MILRGQTGREPALQSREYYGANRVIGTTSQNGAQLTRSQTMALIWIEPQPAHDAWLEQLASVRGFFRLAVRVHGKRPTIRRTQRGLNDLVIRAR